MVRHSAPPAPPPSRVKIKLQYTNENISKTKVIYQLKNVDWLNTYIDCGAVRQLLQNDMVLTTRQISWNKQSIKKSMAKLEAEGSARNATTSIYFWDHIPILNKYALIYIY